MKIWKLIVFILVVGILFFGSYSLKNREEPYEMKLDALRKKLNNLKNEQKDLKENIEYFKNPENLLKEAKTQFNLKKQGENLVIIVPPLNTTSSTTSSTKENQ